MEREEGEASGASDHRVLLFNQCGAARPAIKALHTRTPTLTRVPQTCAILSIYLVTGLVVVPFGLVLSRGATHD